MEEVFCGRGRGAGVARFLRVALHRAVPWLAGIALGISAAAHEGPEHEIDELTALIETRGESADLLIERAVEYSAIGHNAEARRDLERALRLDPGSLHAARELGRLQWLDGRTDEALATVGRALREPIAEPIDRAGLLIQRVEIRRPRGEFRAALDDCNAALRLHDGNPEWYLLRSDLQRRLGIRRQRVAGLEDGLRRTGAGVLEGERVEALLDARRYRAALAAIEPQLASARLQSRWLVRRGRARIGLGQTKEGRADLTAALAEMERRLDATRPDPWLLLDRATALALLGDRDGARQCHELAREKKLDPEITDRIRSVAAP